MSTQSILSSQEGLSGEPSSLAVLEWKLRRLPKTLRQLRFHGIGNRPVRIAEQRDLEDMVRAMLPILGQEWREYVRHPEYSALQRTDYFLSPGHIVLTSKYVNRSGLQNDLIHQVHCDATFYEQEADCENLVVFVYDPQGHLGRPESLECICGLPNVNVSIRCIVGK